jgi:hypothetical protein
MGATGLKSRRAQRFLQPTSMNRFSLIIVTLSIMPSFTAAQANDASLEAARIGWSEIQFHASKLFISLDANVVLSELRLSDIDDRLISPGKGVAVSPDDAIQQLIFTTDFVGRHTVSELLINSLTGAALQRTSHDSGSRFRHRIYRFTDIGAYHKTRWPVGAAEEKLPAGRWPEWSEAGEDLRPYPDEASGHIVTDPGGLLYIAGAAALDEPGDTAEILAFVRGRVHRVQIEVAQPESINVRYTKYNGDQAVEQKGKLQAMKLLIRGEGLDDGDGEDEFELLGLRGDIVMHMDPETRAPLQLNGRVKIAGKVALRIKSLVVR